MYSRILLDIILFFITVVDVQAGVCWKSVSSTGQCQDVLMYNVDQSTCCSVTTHMTGWSPQNTVSKAKILFTNLQSTTKSGPMCHRCHKSCSTVQCGNDKKCRMRKGVPKCVCRAKCHKKRLRYKGPVCGANRRTFKHYCHLAKFNCRKRSQVTVIYESTCKTSCNGVTCLHNKHCIEDQNGLPHCVNCDKCPMARHQRVPTPVCGTDGQTYSSLCDLQKQSCARDIRLKRAYDGRCKSNATCETISCGRKNCLLDPQTSAPRCVLCNNIYCSSNIYIKHTVCGTNNATYTSFCDLQREACMTGVDIQTQYSGKCQHEIEENSTSPEMPVKSKLSTRQQRMTKKEKRAKKRNLRIKKQKKSLSSKRQKKSKLLRSRKLKNKKFQKSSIH